MAKRKSDDLLTKDSVPISAVKLFRMAWQFEQWLRVLVRVELRAAHRDWQGPIRKIVQDRPADLLDRDKKLHHMQTPHITEMSYLTFGELWNIIVSEWKLFEPYFPPRKQTESAIEEVKAIRNRIAHFREPHTHDLDRMRLFLRDMEGGLKTFCKRYTEFCRPAVDPLFDRLAAAWKDIGRGVELHAPHRDWLYGAGGTNMNPLLHLHLECHRHSRLPVSPLQMDMYTLRVGCTATHRMDFPAIYTWLCSLESRVTYISVIADSEFQITFPENLGVEEGFDLVSTIIRFSINNLALGLGKPESAMMAMMHEFPEFILRPNHALTNSLYQDEISVLHLP